MQEIIQLVLTNTLIVFDLRPTISSPSSRNALLRLEIKSNSPEVMKNLELFERLTSHALVAQES